MRGREGNRSLEMIVSELRDMMTHTTRGIAIVSGHTSGLEVAEQVYQDLVGGPASPVTSVFHISLIGMSRFLAVGVLQKSTPTLMTAVEEVYSDVLASQAGDDALPKPLVRRGFRAEAAFHDPGKGLLGVIAPLSTLEYFLLQIPLAHRRSEDESLKEALVRPFVIIDHMPSASRARESWGTVWEKFLQGLTAYRRGKTTIGDRPVIVAPTLAIMAQSAGMVPPPSVSDNYRVMVVPGATKDEYRQFILTRALDYASKAAQALGKMDVTTDDIVRALVPDPELAAIQSFGLPYNTVDNALMTAFSSLVSHVKATGGLDGFRSPLLDKLIEYQKQHLEYAGLTPIAPGRGLEDVGGMGEIKDYLVRRIVYPINNPTTAMRYGVSPPRGVILYGPKGTGKTLLMKSLAAESGVPTVALNLSRILSSYLGETDKNMERVLSLLGSRTFGSGEGRVIVYIDEMDTLGLFRERDGGQQVHEAIRRIQGMLLAEMPNLPPHVVFIGSTNYAGVIDDAFLREGRFTTVLFVGYPRAPIPWSNSPALTRAPNEAAQVLERVVDHLFREVGAGPGSRIPVKVDYWLWGAVGQGLLSGESAKALMREALTQAMLEGARAVTDRHVDRAWDELEMDAVLRANLETMKRFLESLEHPTVYSRIPRFNKKMLEYYGALVALGKPLEKHDVIERLRRARRAGVPSGSGVPA